MIHGQWSSYSSSNGNASVFGQKYLATATDSRQLSAASISSHPRDPLGISDLSGGLLNETILVLENEESVVTALMGSLTSYLDSDSMVNYIFEWLQLPIPTDQTLQNKSLGNFVAPFGITTGAYTSGIFFFLSNLNSTIPGNTWEDFYVEYGACCLRKYLNTTLRSIE